MTSNVREVPKNSEPLGAASEFVNELLQHTVECPHAMAQAVANVLV